MKKVFLLIAVLTSYCSLSQTDYSDSWEDFYSYNNVKDFSKVSNSIYALVDNAIFSYDETSGEIQKFSSVRGLSGETTSGIFYSESTEKLVIGYKTGLLEIVDNKGKISHNNDIERLNITGDKEIRDIAGFNNTLYLSTPFGIVVYDIDKLQFGDTYFIGNNSSVVMVNQTLVLNGKIYAATEQGIFSADVSDPNLIDFNSWTQPTGSLTGNFTHIQIFDNQLYGSKDNEIYRITGSSTQVMATLPLNILQLKASDNFLVAATLKAAHIYNASIAETAVVNTNSDYDFNLQAAYAEGNTVYLGTSDFGILKCDLNDTQSMTEIHPEGPVKNDVFSITAQQNNLWVVYGGYDAAYTPRDNRFGFSHFNGEHWVNRPYNSDYPARDLVHVTLDPDDPGVAYISSWNDGMLYVENDEVTTIYNDQNSSLERLVNPGYPDFYSIRINGSAFDNQGNLWIANAWVNNKLKKRTAGGSWTSFDLSSLISNEAPGLGELLVDRSNSVWIATRRNGVLVYNEAMNKKRALITETSKGALPDPNSRALAVDRNNRVWIGTKKGLVVYFNAAGVFDNPIYQADPVIIDDQGIAKRLLGEQPVNAIAIDGADNKWFGTDTGGILATNSNGQETLYNFNKDNSPLPSNRILKIQVDNSNGKVYFATDKGIVAFKSGVAPYGESLGEVYAYPNPVRKENNFVTIDGRNNTHLPKDTNVKILDSSGRLVYETNVVEGQELKGGKVVWDKTNLAGNRVASGVYIVLLTLPDRSEKTVTKIAVIN